MVKIIRLFILNYLLFICTQPGISQKPPVKFGKIDRELLEMTVYEPDTSAEAVILCNYGRFDPVNFQFTNTIRIKILKKEGYYWANMVLTTPAKGDDKG